MAWKRRIHGGDTPSVRYLNSIVWNLDKMLIPLLGAGHHPQWDTLDLLPKWSAAELAPAEGMVVCTQPKPAVRPTRGN